MAQIPESFILRPIEENDNSSKFSLGDSSYTPLKIFLQKSAIKYHQAEIAKTFVLVDEEPSPRVWAYITLMNSEIILANHHKTEESSTDIPYDAFPAVKIARLAIHKELKGKGYGKEIMEWCISNVKLSIMPHVGCRFIVVDSKKESVSFYEKCGFVLLNTDHNNTEEHPLMFFDLLQK